MQWTLESTTHSNLGRWKRHISTADACVVCALQATAHGQLVTVIANANTTQPQKTTFHAAPTPVSMW